MPAVCAQLQEPKQLQHKQQQLLASLPQSPKKRQKAFSSTVVGYVKAGDAESALFLYGKAAEVGCMISANVFNAVLSVCEGDKVSQGECVLSDMMAAGIKPRESHYAFLLRDAVRKYAFEEAFTRIREMVDGGVQPRLRTYSPLLKGLCRKPDMTLAMEVWSHMVAQGVQPTPEEYVDIIRGWADAGELRQRVADGKVESFLEELGAMAFELEPMPRVEASTPPPSPSTSSRTSPSSTRVPSFQEDETGSGKAGHLHTLLTAFNSDSNWGSSREGDVQTYYSPCPDPIASVTSVVSPSPGEGGVCNCCGASLKVLGLDRSSRARVRTALMKLATEKAYPASPPPPPLPLASTGRRSSRFDGAYREEGQSDANGNQAGRGMLGGAMGDLEQFAAWLEERRKEGMHFTTVVDGCNVAYYGQNKEGGSFQIPQVDLLTKELEKNGERVLVVLPERYLRPCVPNSARSRRGKNPPSALTDRDLETIEEWRQRQMVYSCANGADDDLFWMYFTVSSDVTTVGSVEGARATPADGRRDSSHRRGVATRDNREHRRISGTTSTGSGGQVPSAGEESVGTGDLDRGVDAQLTGQGEGKGSSRGDSKRAEIDDDQRVGDGGGALRLTVVSNDEMRNHRMALLEPVPFKRWRNAQVRGFRFPPSLSAEDTAVMSSGDGGGGEGRGSERCRGQSSPRVMADSEPLPPIVSPSPTFTRDMQEARTHAWHIPIRGQPDGEPGTEWLCVNLAPLVKLGRGIDGEEQVEPSEVQPRRKYRR